MLEQLGCKDAVAAVRWLRYATWRLSAGLRVIGDATTTTGLLALGGLVGTDITLSIREDGWVRARRPDDPSTGRPALDQALLAPGTGPGSPRRLSQRRRTGQQAGSRS